MFENIKQTRGKHGDASSYLTTEQFASLFRVKPESVRRAYCVNGHYLGIQPVKLPNRRLLWPQEPIDDLLPTKQPKP